MTQKRTKNKILERNTEIIHTHIPKYLKEIEENNVFLQQELKKWESVVPGINNPYNMQQHIQKLNIELEQWRNLIPGKHTIKLAQQHLNRSNTKTEENITINNDDDISDMEFYNSIFVPIYGPQYNLTQFGNVESFCAAKQDAINNIRADTDPFTKTINDPYYFIKYFELKKQRHIPDKDFDVEQIETYTKW